MHSDALRQSTRSSSRVGPAKTCPRHSTIVLSSEIKCNFQHQYQESFKGVDNITATHDDHIHFLFCEFYLFDLFFSFVSLGPCGPSRLEAWVHLIRQAPLRPLPVADIPDWFNCSAAKKQLLLRLSVCVQNATTQVVYLASWHAAGAVNCSRPFAHITVHSTFIHWSTTATVTTSRSTLFSTDMTCNDLWKGAHPTPHLTFRRCTPPHQSSKIQNVVVHKCLLTERDCWIRVCHFFHKM